MCCLVFEDYNYFGLNKKESKIEGPWMRNREASSATMKSDLRFMMSKQVRSTFTELPCTSSMLRAQLMNIPRTHHRQHRQIHQLRACTCLSCAVYPSQIRPVTILLLIPHL